jgi:Holliday junction resolvase
VRERNEASFDFLSRLIHEALEQTGWRAEAQTLAARVERLNLGLPVEDEFSVLLAWLGKCCLVHKLDQLQTPPESEEYYQVPDLLAVFEYMGRTLPVLIKVKSKVDDKLSWKADYYERLQRYGQTVGLPVLVAWKYKGLWALFELRHFERPNVNYKISLATALKQNLLGVLAGDFAFVLRSGVGLHMRATKEERLSVTENTDSTFHSG